eukprot:4238676-Amphidinium_carterae.1
MKCKCVARSEHDPKGVHATSSIWLRFCMLQMWVLKLMCRIVQVVISLKHALSGQKSIPGLKTLSGKIPSRMETGAVMAFCVSCVYNAHVHDQLNLQANSRSSGRELHLDMRGQKLFARPPICD